MQAMAGLSHVTMRFDLRRRAAFLLALGLLILVCWAGARAGATLVAARSGALFDAERAIAQAASPQLQQQRIPPGLILSVGRLLDEPGLGLNYITLRNANNVVLLSRGQLGDRFGWLPASQARQWRGFEYRMRSADANRPVLRDEKRIGYAGFGVGWWHVCTRAGADLALWGLVLLASLIGFCWALARGLSPVEQSQSGPEQPAASRPVAKPPSRRRDTRAGGAAPLSRLARRAPSADDEFTPIADPDNVQWPDTHAPEATARERVPWPPAEPPATAPPLAATDEPDDVAEDAVGAQSHPAIEAMAHAGAPAAVPACGPQANRTHADPPLGDDTLDLRFFPIWHDRDRHCLSGAWALLTWRGQDGEMVGPETLTELAENTDALRAFTQWIARRLSMLHGNWRTLELAAVPIVLPIPNAMLGFADVEEVWSDALERTDRDPRDLIVCPQDRAELAGTVLPVRRAVRMESLIQKPAHRCDALCISPDDIDPASVEQWRGFHDVFKRPVLLGPINDTRGWEDILAHEQMHWYSDAQTPENLHTPRSFARLLSDSRINPI